jgi:hypothetical protein
VLHEISTSVYYDISEWSVLDGLFTIKEWSGLKAIWLEKFCILKLYRIPIGSGKIQEKLHLSKIFSFLSRQPIKIYYHISNN